MTAWDCVEHSVLITATMFLTSVAHTWGMLPKETALALCIYGIVVSVRYLVFLLEVSE